MACRICGRGSCTESFHSLASQEAFANAAQQGPEMDSPKPSRDMPPPDAAPGLSVTDQFTMGHNVLNMVDLLLVEAGYSQDSSVRHNLKIAKSIFREAEKELCEKNLTASTSGTKAAA